jgi:PPE-repeat protein
VPPPLIAANRASLAALVATNIVGQNTPAIAATEAQYAQMWAQDAGAMYGYAGASAAATRLTPFSSPPPTTNPAGTSTQAAAVTHAAASPAGAAQNLLSQLPDTLQSLASRPNQIPDAATAAIMSVLNTPGVAALQKLVATFVEFENDFQISFFIPTAALSVLAVPINDTAKEMGLAGAAAAAAAAPAVAAPKGALGAVVGPLGGGGGVSAGLGRAVTVGGLSVPQSWGAASPAIRLAATALPAAGLDGVPEVGAAGLGGWSGGLPMVGGVVNASRNGAAGPRPESRLKVIPQMPGESGGHEGTPDRGMTPTGRAAEDALSDRERYELHTLRNEIAELAKQRDKAARLIKEAIRR